MADLSDALSRLRRRHLPSTAMVSPTYPAAKTLTELLGVDQCKNPPRRVVWRDAMLQPQYGGKPLFLGCPMDAQPSAPQITAHRVMKNRSPSLCRWWRSTRGSGMGAKCPAIEAVERCFMTLTKSLIPNGLTLAFVNRVLMRLPYGGGSMLLTLG